MDEDRFVVPIGIHGRTGKRFRDPIDIEEFSRVLSEGQGKVTNAEEEAVRRGVGEKFALPVDTDPNDVAGTGWGVVYALNTPPEVRAALAPLLEYRSAPNRRFFKEIDYVPGEDPAEFLARFNVAWGSVLPHRLPFHLLLVGSPEDIPFEFQYQLDLEYSVGRLYFDGNSPEAYATYAKNVVEHETGVSSPRRKEVGFFAPVHSGDLSTNASYRHFILPLMEGEPDAPMPPLEKLRATGQIVMGEEATRAKLSQWLGGGANQPAVVWTAGHGMAFDATDAEQVALQGALLTGDWTGANAVERRHYLAGEDLGPDADLRGMVAFLFACFGAGTPRIDSYPSASGERKQIAPRSFVAALPQAMLARGALAVIGHVDLAYGYSFKPRGVKGALINPYSNCLAHILKGHCMGNATSDLSGRAATLGARVAEVFLAGKETKRTPGEMVNLWCERNDARGYVVLGDPAVRLRFA